MGLIAIEQKNPAIAHGYLEQALSIATETGDRRLESRSLGNLGYSAGFIRQDYPSAREYFEKGYVIMHECGERAAESVALGNLGWVAGMQGDLQGARSYLEQALLVSREVGNHYLEAYSLINLSSTTGMANEAQASLAYAQKALAVSQEIGDQSGEAWSLMYMGYAYLLLNNVQLAEESFIQSITIRDQLGQPGLKTEPLAGLIQTALLKDNRIAAISETEKIISFLEDGGTLEGTEEPLRIYYACYLALEKTQDPRSHIVLHRAVQLLEAHMAKLRDEGSRQMYVKNVPWRRAIQEAWRVRPD